MKASKVQGRKPERQIAALPLRAGRGGRLEVLLITSRETRRWIIPKGNPMKGTKKPKVAAIEAEEEAGVAGKVASKPYRSFDYWKRRADGFVLCRVEVFPLFVRRLEASWKEQHQRQRVWVPASIAAQLVAEPGLQTILKAAGRDRGMDAVLAKHAGRLKEGALDLAADPARPQDRLEGEPGTGTNWRFSGL